MTDLAVGFGNASEDQRAFNKMLSGPETYMMGVGGSRSGKTFQIIRAMLIRALLAPGARQAILRQKAAHAYTSIWKDTLPKVRQVCMPWLNWRMRESPALYVTLPGKSEIWIGGLDDSARIDKILGQEHAGLYWNEASQIPWSSVLVSRTRLAQKVMRFDGRELKLRGYVDLNPVSVAHWTNQLFIRRQEPNTKRIMDAEECALYAHRFLNPDANKQNLPQGYIEQNLDRLPERYKMRFRNGIYQPEVEGALWTMEGLDAIREALPKREEIGRVCIGVDPSGASGAEETRSNEIGIVVGGKYLKGDRAAVLEDGTMTGSPAQWGQRVAQLYDKWGADCVVAERNFGGAMVESTLFAANRRMKIKLVTASRGKHVRAEPVAALYDERPVGSGEGRRMAHCGAFPEMEEQMLNFSALGYQGATSPDRADALVWMVTELMLDPESTDLSVWAKLGAR